jgi:hypothetical protein
MVGRAGIVVGVFVALLVVVGCGDGIEEGKALTDEDIHAALESLPFRYEYRDIDHSGHGSVVAGSAHLGRHMTYFAVIAGEPTIKGRVVPRQRLPNGGYQHGVDSTQGPGYVTKFVYTRSSIPRISNQIEDAICDASGGGCKGL